MDILQFMTDSPFLTGFIVLMICLVISDFAPSKNEETAIRVVTMNELDLCKPMAELEGIACRDR